MNFFFDTYAVVEIYKKNPEFRSIAEAGGVTSIFNLAESYYILSAVHSSGLAKKALGIVWNQLVDLSADVVQKAMDFRAEFNSKHKQKLSYADAIGYTYALENGLEFVTGDDAFKGLKRVRFLK